MSNLRQADLTDLVAGAVDDARNLIEAEVFSLKVELADRLGDLGSAIRSWLVVVCVAIVTSVLLGIAIAATLNELGLPWYASFWIITAVAMCVVVGLVFRARANGRKNAATPSDEAKQLIAARALPVAA